MAWQVPHYQHRAESSRTLKRVLHPQVKAVLNHPAVLADGSFLSANGYDPRSGLLVTIPHSLRVTVPDCPTTSDVAAAVNALNDVLTDFPFEMPAHRAAWFAGLLTPLAWFAFAGPAPMFLIDKNVWGGPEPAYWPM
jgi:hypothetical protein